MKNLIASLLLIATVTLFAQKKEIEVGSFNEVSFGISGTLYVTQGSENKLVIDANDEAWERLEVVEDGNRLKIRNQKGSWSWKNYNGGNITAYLTMKDIRGLSVSGSGDIIGKNKLNVEDLDLSVSGSGNMELDLRGEDIDASISGSGKIYLEGQADEVELSISGSGKMKAENFEVNVCNANISGSGSCYITANKEIDARISGSGGVYYNGNPDRVSSKASGSGKVRKM